MKYLDMLKNIFWQLSPSARKVWIEMFVGAWRFAAAITSPSARKVWIEITFFRILERTRRRHLPRGRCGLKYIDAERNIEIILSPSARKVWIEICR